MYDRVLVYFAYLREAENYSDNTIAAYQNDLSQFLDFLGEQRVATWSGVAREHIIEYLFLLRDRDYASSTVARKMAAVKSLLNHLVERGELEENPAKSVDSPRVQKYTPKYLTREELQRLLAEPAKDSSIKGLRDQAMLELLYATGLRVSELVNLEVGDVDVVRSTVRCPGPKESERLIPIPLDVMRSVRTYLEQGRGLLVRDEEEARLFLNMRGGHLTRQGLWLIIRAYVAQAGIHSPVTPHTLRHSFAVHSLHDGANLSEVQELLGHANISTTQVYVQGQPLQGVAPHAKRRNWDDGATALEEEAGMSYEDTRKEGEDELY